MRTLPSIIVLVLLALTAVGYAAYGPALTVTVPASAQGLLRIMTPHSAGSNPSACKDVTPPPGDIPRSYGWNYHGSPWCFTATFPNELEAQYREGDHLSYMRSDTFVKYVEDSADDAWIKDLVARFDAVARTEHMTPQQETEFVASFVQSLPYTSDQVTTGADNYVRYPIQTLIEGGGDCEDTSILLAALLKDMGHGVVLLSPPDHLAVGVAVDDAFAQTHTTFPYAGQQYAYVETTAPGWDFGQVPPEEQGQMMVFAA